MKEFPASLRIDNVLQMYENGAIKPPNLAALLCKEIIMQRRMRAAAEETLEAVMNQSLFEIIKQRLLGWYTRKKNN